MPRKGYVGVSLMETVIKEIDNLIKAEKKLGLTTFESRPDFLTIAAMDLLNKHWKRVSRLESKVVVVTPKGTKKHG